MKPELRVSLGEDESALVLRRWRRSDMAALCVEMGRDYPSGGLHPPGPRDAAEAEEWLAVQDRGWADGDWLTFAVLEANEADLRVVGQVGLKPREGPNPVATCGVGEVSYWTAASDRGRGIAPAAVDAMTTWAFETFACDGLREVMAVHDVDNGASCRVAEKSGYVFRRVSPPNPPMWFTSGHIHTRLRPGSTDG